MIYARDAFVQAVKNDKNHMESFENFLLVKKIITRMFVQKINQISKKTNC